MANGGTASRGPPDGSPAALRGLVQQPLLHAYEARKDPEAHGFGPAEPDGGASFVRTCFNGLNGLSGECVHVAFAACVASFVSTGVIQGVAMPMLVVLGFSQASGCCPSRTRCRRAGG